MERQRDAHRDGAFEELQRRTQRCTRSRKKQKLCRTCACLSEKNRTRCATSGAGSDASKDQHAVVAYTFFRDDAMMRNPASATEKVKKRTFTCKCDESRPARVPCHTSATQPSSRPGTPQELPRDRQSACQAGSESQISSVGFLPVLNFLSTTPRLCAISRHQLASPCTLFCVGDM